MKRGNKGSGMIRESNGAHYFSYVDENGKEVFMRRYFPQRTAYYQSGIPSKPTSFFRVACKLLQDA
jgi:hypothetical protein